jgi:hypothetical protein
MASQPWNFAHVVFIEAPVKPYERAPHDNAMEAHITSCKPESRHELQSCDQRLIGVLDSASEDLHGQAGMASETEIGSMIASSGCQVVYLRFLFGGA